MTPAQRAARFLVLVGVLLVLPTGIALWVLLALVTEAVVQVWRG